jgi:hypothetical protein
MSSEALCGKLSPHRTALAALSRRRSGSPMEPLPKSKAQMVLPAFEVSAFIFFFPLLCGTGKIMAENQRPANTHFRQSSCPLPIAHYLGSLLSDLFAPIFLPPFLMNPEKVATCCRFVASYIGFLNVFSGIDSP